MSTRVTRLDSLIERTEQSELLVLIFSSDSCRQVDQTRLFLPSTPKCVAFVSTRRLKFNFLFQNGFVVRLFMLCYVIHIAYCCTSTMERHRSVTLLASSILLWRRI